MARAVSRLSGYASVMNTSMRNPRIWMFIALIVVAIIIAVLLISSGGSTGGAGGSGGGY
jgi:hypothetical protein